MRKDWNKLFEDFFDDVQDIEIEQKDSVKITNRMDEYEHVFVLCCNCDLLCDKYNEISSNLKKMIKYIQYILNASQQFSSYSPVVLYSNNKKLVQRYSDIIEYRKDSVFYYFDFNFTFGFNYTTRRNNNPMNIIYFLKKIIDFGKLKHLYANELLCLKKGRDDYDNVSVNTCSTFSEISDNLDRTAGDGSFRTYNDFRYILKLMSEVSNEPLVTYNTLKNKYPAYALKFQKQLLNSIMNNIRLQSAPYIQDVKNVVPNNTNAVIKKMKDCFNIENIKNTKQYKIWIYYRNTLITKPDGNSYRNRNGYDSLVLYDSPENILKNKLEDYISENEIKPESIVLKQYDNNTQMALIVYLGTLEMNKNLYDIAITTFSSTTVDNGIVCSEEEWKETLLQLFDISEKDFYVLWNAKKKPEW